VATFATPLSDALAGSGYLLTGDAGVVQLDVRVFYKVTDPYAFVLQGEHVLPALDRLVTRSAVALTAARDLDTILVARPELIGAITRPPKDVSVCAVIWCKASTSAWLS
jgi:regulator of protease activity HflC (stomatin/prohibitin superfamily)